MKSNFSQKEEFSIKHVYEAPANNIVSFIYCTLFIISMYCVSYNTVHRIFLKMTLIFKFFFLYTILIGLLFRRHCGVLHGATAPVLRSLWSHRPGSLHRLFQERP